MFARHDSRSFSEIRLRLAASLALARASGVQRFASAQVRLQNRSLWCDRDAGTTETLPHAAHVFKIGGFRFPLCQQAREQYFLFFSLPLT
jgi:hypothetical protein